MKKSLSFFLIGISLIIISCDNLLSDYDTKMVDTEIKNTNPLLCVFANYFHGKGISLDISSTKSIDMKQIGPEIEKAKASKK